MRPSVLHCATRSTRDARLVLLPAASHPSAFAMRSRVGVNAAPHPLHHSHVHGRRYSPVAVLRWPVHIRRAAIRAEAQLEFSCLHTTTASCPGHALLRRRGPSPPSSPRRAAHHRRHCMSSVVPTCFSSPCDAVAYTSRLHPIFSDAWRYGLHPRTSLVRGSPALPALPARPRTRAVDRVYATLHRPIASKSLRADFDLKCWRMFTHMTTYVAEIWHNTDTSPFRSPLTMDMALCLEQRARRVH
ncbi:hypothetical protein B0H19DRAFT_1383648 [Mycena capillaripes]|nr:hypothetical protein B0H19DRAFT_1383648 [Mycena capillaripes]